MNDWDKKLLAAAKAGDLATAKAALDAGADVHAKNVLGVAALHWAAQKGHLDVAQLLIERGADVHATSDAGSTPLHWAARKGHLDILRLLIENGADVHPKGDAGMTALHDAAQRGHLEVVCLLVERGADVHAKDVYGYTPLHRALTEQQAGVAIHLYRAMGMKLTDRLVGKTLLERFARKPGAKAMIRAAQRAEKAEATTQRLASAFDELAGKPNAGVVMPTKKRGFAL